MRTKTTETFVNVLKRSTAAFAAVDLFKGQFSEHVRKQQDVVAFQKIALSVLFNDVARGIEKRNSSKLFYKVDVIGCVVRSTVAMNFLRWFDQKKMPDQKNLERVHHPVRATSECPSSFGNDIFRRFEKYFFVLSVASRSSPERCPNHRNPKSPHKPFIEIIFVSTVRKCPETLVRQRF